MKKNKILLIAAVACTSMFSSCSDLLDLYPEDSLGSEILDKCTRP